MLPWRWGRRLFTKGSVPELPEETIIMAGHSYSTSTNRNRTAVRTNGLAIAGLICGIVGFVFFSIILGPVAIVLGAVGLRKAKSVRSGSGLAIAAIVTGVIDIVLWFALMAM
jgi:hypothetical protein